MDDPSLARALVDAVTSDFPDQRPGTRPIHTIGIGVEGHFEALARPTGDLSFSGMIRFIMRWTLSPGCTP